MVALRGTILANNNSLGSGDDCYTWGYPIHSNGRNLIESPTQCSLALVSSDLPTGVDPALGPLVDASGTYHHPLSFTSIAKDAAGVVCPAADQLGISRPQGVACDVGASELVIDPEAPFAVDDSYGLALPGPIGVFPPGVLQNDVGPNGDAVSVSSVYTDPSEGLVSMNSNGGFVFTPASLFYATRTFTYQATDGKNAPNFATVLVTSGKKNDEVWTLLEVPEMPWLDPGPYRVECVAIWEDGTIAAQTYGAWEWEKVAAVESRAAAKANTRTSDVSFDFDAWLKGVDGSLTRLSGSIVGRTYSGFVADVRGRRVAIRGVVNPECNAVADLAERELSGKGMLELEVQQTR